MLPPAECPFSGSSHTGWLNAGDPAARGQRDWWHRHHRSEPDPCFARDFDRWLVERDVWRSLAGLAPCWRTQVRLARGAATSRGAAAAISTVRPVCALGLPSSCDPLELHRTLVHSSWASCARGVSSQLRGDIVGKGLSGSQALLNAHCSPFLKFLHTQPLDFVLIRFKIQGFCLTTWSVSRTCTSPTLGFWKQSWTVGSPCGCKGWRRGKAVKRRARPLRGSPVTLE